jgi:hypothetical protein
LGLVSAALGTDSGLPEQPDIIDTVLLFNDLKVLYLPASAPEFNRIRMQYIHDNDNFPDKEFQCTWQVFGPDEPIHNVTINDIQGSGWLYIRTEDYDAHLSPKDSIYVEWVVPQSELIIYPNPCANYRPIYINWWTGADNITNTLTENEVRIYDIKGRLVEKISPNAHKQGSGKIDISHLASGIYIARVKVGKQELTSIFTVLSDD